MWKILYACWWTVLNFNVELSSGFFFGDIGRQLRRILEYDRPCNLELSFRERYFSTPEIIAKYGYPVERHWTTTDDGYILGLHRIPAPGKRVVFLLHGIFGTSRDFVINCERRALAFTLHRAGYDVWLGNYRGNTYSHNHTRLSPEDPAFWDFAVDDVGYYDGPASVDYILGITGKEKLSYIGHSMGNGVALTMLLQRPEYNKKIDVWFALAAAMDLRDTQSPPLRLAAPLHRQIERFLGPLTNGQAIPAPLLEWSHRHLPLLCLPAAISRNPHGICSLMSFFIDGYDPAQIDPMILAIYVAGFPSSMSLKFTTQWFQWIVSGNFTKYDAEESGNLRKYGAAQPPLHQLENLATDVYLFWAENDFVTTSKSVERTLDLTNMVPNAKARFNLVRVNSATFNHFAYVLGKDADAYVYQPLLKILAQYDLAGNESGKT